MAACACACACVISSYLPATLSTSHGVFSRHDFRIWFFLHVEDGRGSDYRVY